MPLVTTLCLVHTPTHVLLGMKKRGFGEGRWNGFGGKVKPEETVEEAALREMREEASVDLCEYERAGVLLFSFQTGGDDIEVHVFRVTKINGEPVESEEMNPKWFRWEDVPFDSMWPDDQYWLPLLQAGKYFRGHFVFSDMSTIVGYRIVELAKASEIDNNEVIYEEALRQTLPKS